MASDSLSKFVEAQSPVYDTVLKELSAGKKATHWMWFIFPQLKALGRSATAKHFGLEGRDEAAAYWRHPVLGPRLMRCAELVAAIQGKTAQQIFDSPDEMKLKSCMTLFEAVAPYEPVFRQVLDRFFEGKPDLVTSGLLGNTPTNT